MGGMGGKGGSPYRSDYLDEGDQLAWQTAQSFLSGQPVSPSPAMTGSYVAQSIGGSYDPKTNTVTAPDGSTLTYDPLAGQFTGGSGGGSLSSDWRSYTKPDGSTFKSQAEAESYISGGGDVYMGGKSVNTANMTSSPYIDKANEIAATFSSNVYDDPNSAWNLYGSLGNEYSYNPSTGAYEQGAAGADQNMGADYYFGKYGDPFSQQYNQFDYTAPTVGSVDNVSDAARMNIYQRGADRIATNFRDQAQQTEDWISSQGGNLSSGRALALKNKDMEDKNRGLTELQRDTDTEHEMRNYNDAIRRRDMQTDLDWQAQKLRGDESRYGQNWTKDMATNRLATAEGLDAAQRDRSFGELQANRQQKLNQYGALSELMRIWSGLEGNWTNAQAAKAQAVGSALGGLGKLGGGAFEYFANK